MSKVMSKVDAVMKALSSNNDHVSIANDEMFEDKFKALEITNEEANFLPTEFELLNHVNQGFATSEEGNTEDANVGALITDFFNKSDMTNMTPTSEEIKGIDIGQFKTANLTANMIVMKDEIGDTFFPVQYLKASEIALQLIKTENMFVKNKGEINTNGQAVSAELVPFYETLRSDAIFTTNDGMLVPKFSASIKGIDERLLTAAATDTSVSGKTFKTAPYKTDIDIDIRALASTDILVAGAQFDVTSEVSSDMAVNNIYIQVGTGGGAKLLKIDASRFRGRIFSKKTTDSMDTDSSMVCNIGLDNLVLNTKEMKDITGTKIDAIGALPGEHLVRFTGSLHGTASTTTGTVQLTSASLVVDSVVKIGTGVSASKADITTISTFAKTLTVVGFDLNASVAISNFEQMGQSIETKSKSVSYGTRMSKAFSIINRSPEPAYNGATSDLGVEREAKNSAILAQSAEYFSIHASARKLLDYVNALENLQISYGGILSGNVSSGIGEGAFKPYFNRASLDISKNVKYRNTGELIESINSTISNKLNAMVIDMVEETNIKSILPSDEIEVLIATDDKTGTIFKGIDKLVTGYSYKIASSVVNGMKDKVIITISSKKPLKDSQGVINAYKFGFNVKRPNFIIKLLQGNKTLRSLFMSDERHTFYSVAAVLDISKLLETYDKATA